MINKIQYPAGKNSSKNLWNITLKNRKKLKTNKLMIFFVRLS